VGPYSAPPPGWRWYSGPGGADARRPFPSMTNQAPTSDPRSIITPDAFEVSADLLGLPLATPTRRGLAILIDLAVIGVVTAVTSSFALVLGVVAAIFFVRAGFKRTPVRGSVFGRAMRLSVGCLGLVIGITTAVVWTAVGFGRGGQGEQEPKITVGEPGVRVGAMELLGGLRSFEALRRSRTEDQAEDAARDLARRLRQLSTPDREIRGLLLEAVPSDAEWSDLAPFIVDRAMEGEVPPAVASQEDLAAVADTLRILEEEVEDLRSAMASQRETMDDLAQQLAQERRGGTVFSSLRSFVDELGFGFGWASLYLTVMLSWWKGQTVGKRALGIRVLRLDGEPITWWTAFERAGGYAAGFATGLLGFAQIYWDANRQAIHDRIVGTVVVMDGAPRVGNWEEAL